MSDADLVKELRGFIVNEPDYGQCLTMAIDASHVKDAADRIEALAAEVERLRAKPPLLDARSIAGVDALVKAVETRAESAERALVEALEIMRPFAADPAGLIDDAMWTVYTQVREVRAARKKPVVIEAFQFGFDKPDLWWKSAVDAGDVRVITPVPGDGTQYALIRTLEGEMTAQECDWIIRGVKGELYPCKPDIFEQTYEAVE